MIQNILNKNYSTREHYYTVQQNPISLKKGENKKSFSNLYFNNLTNKNFNYFQEFVNQFILKFILCSSEVYTVYIHNAILGK